MFAYHDIFQLACLEYSDMYIKWILRFFLNNMLCVYPLRTVDEQPLDMVVRCHRYTIHSRNMSKKSFLGHAGRNLGLVGTRRRVATCKLLRMWSLRKITKKKHWQQFGHTHYSISRHARSQLTSRTHFQILAYEDFSQPHTTLCREA